MNSLSRLWLNALRMLCTALALSALPSVHAQDHGGHSGMDHSGHSPEAAADPHAGHTAEKSATDKETGKAAASSRLREPIPKLSPEDRAAAFPEIGAGHAAHGTSTQGFMLFDRLEAWNADAGTGLAWEAQGWIGGDINRMWLRGEGERIDGATESSNVELLYGRSIDRWWDVVAGARHDMQPGESQDFAAIGLHGLAPYFFEVEATFYIGESGQSAARLEVETDILLTNRLILQPAVELDLYRKNDARRGIGSGLSKAEAGLRLRYEIRRELAPYIGINWEQAYGDTADFTRALGEDVADSQWVAGLRTWF